MNVVASFFNWLQARDPMITNPAKLAGRPKVHNTKPRAIPDGVWLSVWNDMEDPIDRAWLGLGFFAGLRRQELVAVRRCNWNGRELVDFPRKGGGDDLFPLFDVLDKVFAAKLPQLFGRWSAEQLLADIDLLWARCDEPDEARALHVLFREDHADLLGERDAEGHAEAELIRFVLRQGEAVGHGGRLRGGRAQLPGAHFH